MTDGRIRPNTWDQRKGHETNALVAKGSITKQYLFAKSERAAAVKKNELVESLE